MLSSLEVEEHADLPGAMVLKFVVSHDDRGELSPVGDRALAPYANLSVVVRAAGGDPECVFDGYVLSHRTHVEQGANRSSLEVWARDASWLMNLEEKSRLWTDVTDGAVANSVFGEYGFVAHRGNTDDDGPAHTEQGHALQQRATDGEFLRDLAHRGGKLCRVVSGRAPGLRTGWFAKPDLSAAPACTLSLSSGERGNVRALDFEWDVARPTATVARQGLFNDDSPEGASGDQDDAGDALLGDRSLSDFAGRAMSMLLTTTVDGAGDLQARARAVLREASHFVRCTGEADLSELGVVLRAGAVVEVAGVGSLYAGKYLVWSVRHAIDAVSHRLSFTLTRNAMGRAAGGLPGGLP